MALYGVLFLPPVQRATCYVGGFEYPMLVMAVI